MIYGFTTILKKMTMMNLLRVVATNKMKMKDIEEQYFQHLINQFLFFFKDKDETFLN